MTLQDPFAHPARGQAQRARWRRSWDGLRARVSPPDGRQWRGRRDTDLLGSMPRMRPRGRRRLAAMESALTRDTPQLASMFTLFNQLTKDDQPRGPERVLAPAKRPLHSAHVAVLVTLAAVTALCFGLSTQIRPVPRQCATAATTAATVTSTATPAASQPPAATPTPAAVQTAMAAAAVDAVVRGLNCAAYSASKAP
jgi:hypothetical protein